MRVVVIVPVLDEAGAIGDVVEGVRRATGAAVVVVDGGSRDGTAERAREAGGGVVVEPRPGFGRACLRGIAEARRLGADVVAFLDGSGADDPADLPAVLAPIRSGAADFVLGTRTRGRSERGALRPWQRLGNALAVEVIALRTGVRYTELGSMRAIRLDALERLDLHEQGSGWPAAMQVRAARAGLRIQEVAVARRRRRTGRSKVSGDLRGAIRAGFAILRVVLGALR